MIPYLISLLGPESVNAVDSKGKTPLHHAADRGSISAVKHLLDAKADYNAVCQYDNTARFVNHPIDAKYKTICHAGNTAFHYAAYSHQLSVMERLIEAKCDTHALNKEKQSPLHLACHTDRIGLSDSAQLMHDQFKRIAIRFLLELKGAEMDVKAIDSHGNLPLHYLSAYRSTANDTLLAEMMLKLGGIEIAFHQNKDHETPLVKAAWAGNEMLFLFLFNLRSQKKYPPEQLARAFYAACEGNNWKLSEGHKNIAGHFVDLYKKEFGIVPTRIPFLLLNACNAGLLQIVELLFKFEKVSSFEEVTDRRFHLDHKLFSTDKTTPLQVAIYDKHNDVLKFLLTKTPMEKLTDELVFKLLSLACYRQDLGAFDIILDKKFKNNRKKIRKFLNKRSASLFIDAMNYQGIENGESTVVALLQRLISLSDDSYKLARDKGLNLLHMAVRWGHLQVAELLLKNKFNVNQLTDTAEYTRGGSTPLMLACEGLRQSSAAIVNLLLTNKANLEIESPDKETALTVAVINGSFEITRTLIEAKADYQIQDKSGNSLLHTGIYGGQSLIRSSHSGRNSERHAARLIQFLIKIKADLHAKNSDGDSPLHYAILKVFPLAVELLVRNRADIMQLDASGKTALQKAESLQDPRSQGSIEIAKYLAIEHEKRRVVNTEKVVESNDGQQHLVPTS